MLDQQLKGTEVDILADGRLDYPDSILAKLDLVIGAIHLRFDLPPAKQTERVLRAIDHRCFTILVHPTCRLLGSRAGIDIDVERIIRAAAERGCFLELSAQPERLDLDDHWPGLQKLRACLSASIPTRTA